jgi:hypothetical protein
MVDKEEIVEYNEETEEHTIKYIYRNPIFNIFDHDLYAELYNARCHDVGEPATNELA